MPPKLDRFQLIMLTAAIVLATTMQVLDSTIAHVALPHMQGTFGSASDQMTWVLTAYIVAAAVMTLPISWLSQNYGRRKIFLIAIVGFTLASVCCSLAFSLRHMILFRFIQGIFGASLVPLSQSALLDIHPKENHRQVMALWGIGIMMGPVLGPTLGGYLIEYHDWRWAFYINLPLGLVSWLGIFMFMPETMRRKYAFNVFGFLTLSIFVFSLQLIFDRAHQIGWFDSAETWIYFFLGFCALSIFGVHNHYSESPVLSPILIKNRHFILCLLFLFVLGSALSATFTLLLPFMQTVMLYSASDAGLLLAPRGLGTMCSMLLVAVFLSKVHFRWLLLFGALLMAFSLYEMSQFNGFVSSDVIVKSGFIQGLGFGMIFTPLSTEVLSTLSGGRYRTEAAAWFSLIRSLGSSLGISLAMNVLMKDSGHQYGYLRECLTAFELKHQTPDMLPLLHEWIEKQSLILGLTQGFYTIMWSILFTIPLLSLFRSKKISAAS